MKTAELIEKYIEKTGYGMDMWSKEETEIIQTISELLQSHPSPMSAEQVELLESSKIALHTLDCIEFTREQGTASKRLETAISKLATTPSVKADGWVEQARNSFGLIVKWCEDSGLKQCDIGNKKHMAIYHSLHAAKNALNDFPVSIPAPPKQ